MSYILGLLMLTIYLILAAAVSYGDVVTGVREGKAIEPTWRNKVKIWIWVILGLQAGVGVLIPLLVALYRG